ncbi:solute carrier family 12 member 9-like isoform X2 [Homarus americanus]|uniref:solute carrier family 12 member 9-like isoform X2 n=1 Tax=Homarus americanus TaxID=6706 RepID=UPI001C456C69|nr:solute carrier family 12 member 9-like isoform X2 [Homarus americanus]
MANSETPVNSTNAEFGGGGDAEAVVGVSKKERAPLLTQRRLFRSLSGRDISTSSSENNDSDRTLGTLTGVFAPVCLSQFSALLFLRVGFIVGNLGLLAATGTLTLAYGILLFTVLSICAISTNGAVEGGGAYYMISRTLGPEFGGAIGALFFFANIFSSALYTTGCVEGLVDNFGESGRIAQFLQEGRWYSFAYGSAINFFNLLICLIGAGLFAKLTIVIFAVVLFCIGSVILSFPINNFEIEVQIPAANPRVNSTHQLNGTYTGFSLSTLEDNFYLPDTTSRDYTSCSGDDYDTCTVVTFAMTFGVLFSGVTGIMVGANMSGELKAPGRSIPWGTLMSALFTYLIYILIFILTAATCEHFLLCNNYIYMMGINIWRPFVMIGVVTATLSASLSNIIGSSRILAALAKDNIYGKLTYYIGLLSCGTNPVGAVLVSAILVEGVLLIGGLNNIAKFTSIFFLLSYLSTNLACLGLEWASAPNFRPTFRYFSWWTAMLGIIGNGAMMFVISPSVAGICVIMLLILVIILHLRSPSEQHQWGSISQALIFHQVRKYLLLLDSRKDHVKFWRPQMLLMVNNPRSACPLIDFTNDLKKSGLYVLGHVKIGIFDGRSTDPAAEDYPKWMALVDHLKVKAFVEVTVGRTVREGLHHLVRVSGLGAMKPNTILLGFRDNAPSQDFFTRYEIPATFSYGSIDAEAGVTPVQGESSPFNVSNYQATSPTSASPSMLAQGLSSSSGITPEEYVGMVSDVLSLGKNVCLCRHFHQMDKAAILRKDSRQKFFIDVWPVDFFNPDDSNIFGTTSLFLMQLATILNMVSSWRKRTMLRVFLCVSSGDADPEAQSKQVKHMLHELRINATIVPVPWDHITSHIQQNLSDSQSEAEADADSLSHLNDEYINGVNGLISGQSVDTAVTFLYLPRTPQNPAQYPRYLELLTNITNGLRPTVMVHGISAVTTTTL